MNCSPHVFTKTWLIIWWKFRKHAVVSKEDYWKTYLLKGWIKIKPFKPGPFEFLLAFRRTFIPWWGGPWEFWPFTRLSTTKIISYNFEWSAALWFLERIVECQNFPQTVYDRVPESRMKIKLSWLATIVRSMVVITR